MDKNILKATAEVYSVAVRLERPLCESILKHTNCGRCGRRQLHCAVPSRGTQLIPTAQ